MMKSDRRGFTMIELLVGLTLSSILVTIIFQLMMSNSRFVQFQSSREEVQQNARAALDLIAGDLRMVPASGIQLVAQDSIRFYVPRAWGVLCDTIDATSATAWAIFPAGVLTNTDVFDKANMGVAIEQTGDPVAHTDSWRFVAAPSQETAGNPCGAVQNNLNAQHVTLGFNRPGGSSFVNAGDIFPGTQLLIYEEIKYDVAPSASSAVPGNWIRRMVGRTGNVVNMQPMAGPVPESGALSFAYYRADGAATSTPSEVRRINVRVITQSRSEMGTPAGRRPEQMDTVSTDVFLRNVAN